MMQPPPNSPQGLTLQQQAEQRLEAERMQEVRFMLKNLLDREQITVKAIISCLLDVGTIHFINDRVQIRPLRSLARPLVKVSKPALVFVANRWVQKRCPQIITNWLQRRILLKAKRPQPPVAPQPTPQVTIEPTVIYQHEIRRLRSRVQLTTGALVGVSGVLVLALIGIDIKAVPQLWQSAFIHQTTALSQSQEPKQK
jgi:hypothetical protein